MVNKVILLGNLGKDPLVRRTEAGVPVATFSLATTERYKDKDGNMQDKTEWHNIVVWRGLAEVAEKYLKKGSKVYLEGKITTRSYEQEGVRKYITEIVADNFQMLDTRKVENHHDAPLPEEPTSYSKTPAYTAPKVEVQNFNDDGGSNIDDLPF